MLKSTTRGVDGACPSAGDAQAKKIVQSRKAATFVSAGAFVDPAPLVIPAQAGTQEAGLTQGPAGEEWRAASTAGFRLAPE